MTTFFKSSGRVINIENLTHANIYPEVTLLNPVGFYTIRVTGDDAKKAVELMRATGFLGNAEILVNPLRLVAAEDNGATAKLLMDGCSKVVMVPIEFLSLLKVPVFPALESVPKTRSKKSSV